jgi:hypothetical protein
MTMHKDIPFDSDAAKSAVITVGPGGRGFIMETAQSISLKGRPLVKRRRIIVTAAHCLPHLPPAHRFPYTEEVTYAVLGPLGTAQPSIMAECLFVDPVADIAVLGEPDGQAFVGASDEFHDFMETTTLLSMSQSITDKAVTGWLLSLDGRWTPCTLAPWRGLLGLCISESTDGIRAGMSGSPILLEDGTAIGVVGISGGSQAILMACLPGWILQTLRGAGPRRRRDAR